MAATVVYVPATEGYRVIKGRVEGGKPHVWTVQARYQAGDRACKITLRTKEPVWLSQLSELVVNAINADKLIFGEITGLRWTAVSR